MAIFTKKDSVINISSYCSKYKQQRDCGCLGKPVQTCNLQLYKISVSSKILWCRTGKFYFVGVFQSLNRLHRHLPCRDSIFLHHACTWWCQQIVNGASLSFSKSVNVATKYPTMSGRKGNIRWYGENWQITQWLVATNFCLQSKGQLV